MKDLQDSKQSEETTTAHVKKLSAGEKIAYGVGSANDAWGNWFLVGAVWPVFNEHLGVAPWLISLALMLNRFFDAVSDPFLAGSRITIAPAGVEDAHSSWWVPSYQD